MVRGWPVNTMCKEEGRQFRQVQKWAGLAMAEDQTEDDPAPREAGTDQEKGRREISTNGHEPGGGHKADL